MAKKKELTKTQAQKAKRGICIECRCTKKRNGKNLKCAMHLRRDWAEKYPLRYRYGNLRGNAKKRGLSVDVTREQFEAFAIENGYLDGVGRHAYNLHIDRPNAARGYALDNMRVLVAAENCRKAYSERGLRKPYEHVPDPECGF
jgi:hypothetical protein